MTANCRKNEVAIPRVIGMTLARAKLRLAGQPLTPNVVYKPAEPKQRLDLVLDQFPRRGRASLGEASDPHRARSEFPNRVSTPLATTLRGVLRLGVEQNADAEFFVRGNVANFFRGPVFLGKMDMEWNSQTDEQEERPQCFQTSLIMKIALRVVELCL